MYYKDQISMDKILYCTIDEQDVRLRLIVVGEIQQLVAVRLAGQ